MLAMVIFCIALALDTLVLALSRDYAVGVALPAAAAALTVVAFWSV